jgi:hypothetical protein
VTRDQALRRIAKLTGATATRIRLYVYEKLSSPERRAAAAAELEATRERLAAIEAEVAAIIAGHARLQELYAERRELRPIKERAASAAHYRKFSAGLSEGIGTLLIASGDTWEEVLENVVLREARRRAEREARAAGG